MSFAPTETISAAFEYLHVASLPSIELLQKSFPHNQQLMINISTLLDPRYVFLVYAPLLFALNRRVGHRLVVALTLAEWANQILKWLLAGERPYWYALERAEAAASAQNRTYGIHSYDASAATTSMEPNWLGQPVELRQFPVTCELGAGSPSGHAMVTATVWYVLVDAYLRGELLPPSPLAGHSAAAPTAAARLGWSMYALVLAAVSLSRVYLACHFPHQCLAGALLGCLAARLVVEWLPMERLRRRHFALATCAMFLTVMATFGLLKSLGVDPLWSVAKGMRWCVRRDYIHLDTTPFASMTRYLGFCLGAGLAYEPSELHQDQNQHHSAAAAKGAAPARRLATFALALAFGQLLLAAPTPRSNQQLFYLISFLTYTLFAWAIAGPIPKLTRRLLAARPTQQARQKSQ